MPVQLMKLRGVPEDELSDLIELLDEAGIAWYQTTAGNWGISLPALWLSDETQLAEATNLLSDYQHNRYQEARTEYERLRAQGKARGWREIISENPLRFLLYMGLVILMIVIATVPWFNLGLGADHG